MSLLGIDVGTTGCKSAAFSLDGSLIASDYTEYAQQHPQVGYAELDAFEVWTHVEKTIKTVADQCVDDPITALSVSSLGEAVVPVTASRRILGPSLLNVDPRGNEFLSPIKKGFSKEAVYQLTGHSTDDHLGLSKILWWQNAHPDIYDAATAFLPWASLVAFMLGAEPAVDDSLASRLLAFDLDNGQWAPSVLNAVGLNDDKLPAVCRATTVVGTVSDAMADMLGLSRGVKICAGCHDQCATAVGLGAIKDGFAACGMGSFFCITPVYSSRPSADSMLHLGLNTERHAIDGKFVSLLYNQGGLLLRWYRDTFATADQQLASTQTGDIYDVLLQEMPADPSSVLVLPHFIPTGPPEFLTDCTGVIAGLTPATKRGDVAKAIMEGVFFYMKSPLTRFNDLNLSLREFRAAGGGSRSDAWLQTGADILGRSFVRTQESEAGLLGAAIIAGVGTGEFGNFDEAVDTMVETTAVFEPRANVSAQYDERFKRYQALESTMRNFADATQKM